jgi:Flp pilus assembly protein TadB
LGSAVVAWLGMSLCVAAVPRRWRGPSRRGPHRLAHAYDRSRAGRRLRRRLDAAEIEISPATWRAAQLMAWVPATLAVSLLGASLPAAAALGASVVRGGGVVLLRSRSGRRAAAVEAAVPVVARSLAAELGRGIGLTDALSALRDPAHRQGRAVASLVAGLAAAASVGEHPDEALARRAGAEAGPAAVALRRLAGAVALARRGGGPVALRRVADAIDQRRRLRHQAAAGVAEARWTALLVPLIAVVVLALLLTTSPGAASAALSPLGVLVLGMCAAVCGLGVLAVRRLTAA